MWKVLVLLVVASAAQAVDWSAVQHLSGMRFPGVESRGLVEEHIVGGQEAAPGQFPYQVGIIINMPGGQSAFCGGSILDEQTIITAAHCAEAGSSFEVIAGAQKIKDKTEQTQQRMTTTTKLVHENWRGDGLLANDIALLRLPQPLQLNAAVQKIRLPSKEQAADTFWKKQAIMSGWGRDSDSAASVSPTLRFVQSRVVTNLYCSFRYFFLAVRSTNICVSGWWAKGTCNGDSGGPLAIVDEDGQSTLIGLTSFGIGFGCEKSWPPVFTRVASYLDWIEAAKAKLN